MNQIDPSQSKLEISAEKNRKLFNRYLIFFFVIFLIILSFWFGYIRGKDDTIEKVTPITTATIKNKFSNQDREVDFTLFWKVWDILKDKYVDRQSLNAQELLYGSIEGMLYATGDPYSNFFDPKQTEAFSREMEGNFEGIGAELGIKDRILTVISPLENSPAQKAGLRAGDKIIKIEDKISADISIDEAVKLIRGKKGTEVKLTVLHKNKKESAEVIITRDTIIVKSVELKFKENEIAHIKINKFADDTYTEFHTATKEILNRKTKGIILDVRNNPGGYLHKTVDIAGLMIPKGRVVVIEEDNTGKKRELYTDGKDYLSQIPTVVLINEGSASASEILAGALRDNQGTSIIGKKSFGKGSVQELIALPGDSSVKVTVAKWMTPNGDCIMDTGISPDIEVELTLEDYNNDRDPQLDKAIEILNEKINQ